MDPTLLSMIQDLEVVTKFNHYASLNPSPNLFTENQATCTNSGGDTTGFQAAQAGDTIATEIGSGVMGGRSLKIECAAGAAHGAMVSAGVAATPSVNYTMYALLKGTGIGRLEFAEKDNTATYQLFSYSPNLVLTGQYQIVEYTKEMRSDTAELEVWWVNGSDNAAASINVGANILKQTAY